MKRKREMKPELEQSLEQWSKLPPPDAATVRDLHAELRAMALGRWSPTILSTQQLVEEAKRTKNLTVLDHSHDQRYRFSQIAEHLERLPIHNEGIVRHGWCYFVMVDCAGWWPVHAGEIKDMPWGRTLNGSTHFSDGSVDTVVSLPGKWAHCTADNCPCMDYEDILPPTTPANIIL